jgi:uncharacterized protein YjbI with pentapeptide repeats
MADETGVEREAQWWAEWFEVDYSWEGLTAHVIQGGGLHGEATLQDYWRRDPATGRRRTDAALRAAGELAEFDGRLWHIVHLPPQDAAGLSRSWKADPEHLDWVRVSDLLAARLAMSREARGHFEFEEWVPEGPDGRALLDGGVLRAVLSSPDAGPDPIHLSCAQAWIGRLDGSGRRFGAGVSFDHAIFSGPVHFEGAYFTGAAGFYGASFLSCVSFSSATFSCAIKFEDLDFLALVDFDGAVFSGKVEFTNVTFHETRFGGAKFNDELQVSESIFLETVVFGLMHVCERASFYNLVFSSACDFILARFSGSVDFSRVVFHHLVEFSAAIFEKDLFFSAPSESFGFEASARADFSSAVFEGAVVFRSTIAEPERGFAGAFYAARFLDIADFSNAVAPDQAGRLAAAFEETQFERVLILTDGSDRQARAYFHRLMAPGPAGKPCRDRDARLRRLEAGCRTIKIAMGKARDELREQRYYRFQLRARQQRSDIDRWEKAFGWLYGVTSDFGSSLWRPLVGLAVLVLFFAVVIYWPWMAWLGLRDIDGPGGVFVALNQSLRTLSPFNLLTGPGMTAAGGSPTTLFEVNPAVTFGARIVSGLQSILSGVLIFLFGLAVKRRFQIS